MHQKSGVETGLFMVGHRYYNPEWGRWLSPDDIEYLDPHSINGLNLYAYCNNNPIMYYDPTGHSAILAMLIGAGIGALVGLVSQAITDVAANMFSGKDVSEWEFSSWQTYVGAAVGGAVGGALTPFMGPVATGFINGTVTSLVGMGLENLTGAEKYSFSEIVWTSIATGTLSGVTAGIIDNIKIPGLNKGRGSLSAIQKQINTKLVNGSISNVSLKTIGKMLALEFINSIPSTFMNSFINGTTLITTPIY